MGRSRDIADMLGKTELVNTNNERLITAFDTVDSAYVSSNVTPALVFYSTLDSLPVSGLSVGQQAYVSANNRLYISDGSGWYNKALITLSPTMTLSPSGTITLANDGVTTSTVTIVANDSDTPGSGLTYSVESDGNMLGRAVISQDSSVFTIRPLSSDSGATDGTFTLTFKTSDGVNLATDSADFSLTFSTIVDSSAETILLVKATGNSLDNDAITYQNSSDVSTGFTETGDPQAGTFSPYRSGGYSTYFSGSGNLNWSGTYLDSDYTIEAWIYTTEVDNSGYNNILSDQSSNVQFSLHNPSNGNMYTIYQSAVKLGPTATGTGLNEWVHFVWEREGTTLRHYCNGSLLQSGTVDNNAFTISKIGQYYTGGYEHNGYIRDLRVMSSAKYGGSSYTVPTEPLAYTDEATTELLACHLPFIKAEGVSISLTGSSIDTSPSGPYDYSPWTADDVGGSVYFDGTSDYMEVSNSSDFAFGTGDFTVEAWVNYTTFSGSGGQAIVSNGTSISSGTSGHWYLTAYGATDLRFGRHGVAQYTSVTSNLVVNAWNHIAVTRSGTTVRIFVNGVSLSTSDTGGGVGSYDFNNTSGILMIGEGASFSKASGHIADVRIIKGTAQYTSNFTPPTAPLSHTGSGTSLLMNNKSDANIYDAAAGSVLTSNTDIYGDRIRSNTNQRKFTTSSSWYFSGDGAYITVPSSEIYHFGTGDFTIEGWIYLQQMSGDYFIISASGTGGLFFGFRNNTDIGFGRAGVAWDYNTPSGITTGSWYHVAFVRSSSTVYLFVNGTAVGTPGTHTDDYNLSTTSLNIGSQGANYYLIGFMQDLRVTKGYARYTANFTPPTAEFEL